jgi:hypothetical protein
MKKPLTINEDSLAFRWVRFCLNTTGRISNADVIKAQGRGFKNQTEWLYLVIEHLRKNHKMKITVENYYSKFFDFHRVTYKKL